MKKLELETPHYQSLLQEYTSWLRTLGYAAKTVKTFPIHLQEFFHFLETNNCKHITHLKDKHAKKYRIHIETRKNETQGGGLHQYTINKQLKVINNFMTFLSYHHFDSMQIHYTIPKAESSRSILTREEITKLYESTYKTKREGGRNKGQRDRAILAIYYGCGLRLNEGAQLNIEDIDRTNKVLLVRVGKNNKERKVPIADKCLNDLIAYMEEGRDWYQVDHNQPAKGYKKKLNPDQHALFLNYRGQRMQSSGFYYRLKCLKAYANINKQFSLHSLRHSIATHLLTAGMDLERIKEFLGHSTLESTQIYTHIAYE